MRFGFIARRLIALVVTLFAASAIVFFALSLAPGDPAVLLSGTNRPTPEMLAAIRREYHLDDPAPVRYIDWLGGILTGDLGRSTVFGTDVVNLIAPRIGTTLALVVYAGILITLLGVGSGILAGLRPGLGARAVTAATAVSMGAPTFVVAVLLTWIFATQLGWFPVYGAGSGFFDTLWHLTLPAVALSLAYTAYVSRITSASVAEELRSEHVDTALTRGLPFGSVIRRHVIRNAAAPILTVTGITVAGLLAASVVVEAAFGIDGIGSLLVSSAAAKDIPTVQTIVLLIVAVFVIVTTVIDIATATLDPRLGLRESRP